MVVVGVPSRDENGGSRVFSVAHTLTNYLLGTQRYTCTCAGTCAPLRTVVVRGRMHTDRRK